MQDAKQVVVFMLENVQYGFAIEQVNEIIRYMVPTKIPATPDYIEGVISLRGHVHAVVDLRNLLGLSTKKADDNTKIIIANNNRMGFIVDEVSMIVTPKKEEIDSAERLPMCNDNDYVLNILKIDGDIVVVLDMTSILDNNIVNSLETI
jgi:purine-binding chemotaxis protein CheW